ncbi:MAG: hypothetical protein Q9191_006954 [Dirinaria sp. TL-2023a]
MSEDSGIPKTLLDLWHLESDQLLAAISAGALGDLSVSSLLKSSLGAFIDNYHAEQSRGRAVPSLKSTALAAVLRVLNSADDLDDTAQYIISNLDDVAVRYLLMDVRMRYPVLRACLTAANKRMEKGRDFIDVDDAVYFNACYIMSGAADNDDEAYIVTLGDFCKMLSVVSIGNGYGRLTRKSPPKGGLELLDLYRKSAIDFCTTSVAFGNNLQYVTRNILRGLDWENVLLAGDLVLQTLLHGQDIQEDDKFSTFYGRRRVVEDGGLDTAYGVVYEHDHQSSRLSYQDIHLYIYGLSVEEANAKVDEIYTVWANNCAAMDEETTVIKTASGISLLSSPPIRPIKIKLKLFKNVTEALLYQDLDQCQIGYDGLDVMMLPSCARALETGYMTLKMHSVVGSHDSGRVRLRRFLDHADQGFGLRVIPLFAAALEESVQGQSNLLADRNRCDIAAGFEEIRSLARQATSQVAHKLNKTSREFLSAGSYMNSGKYEIGLPGGIVLGNVKQLFEFSEAWRQKVLDNQHLVPWVPHEQLFHSDELSYRGSLIDYQPTQNIDEENQDHFLALQHAICGRLQIPYQPTGYNNYLTRRIRRQVYGPTLDAVQEKQITIPIVIPLELDLYLRDTVASLLIDHQLLLQVHDPSKHDPQTARLPSLRDVSDQTGNVRYWLITNRSMWTGQDPLLDEISQILWIFVGWFDIGSRSRFFRSHHLSRLSFDTGSPLCLFWVVQCLRRRLGPHPQAHHSDNDLRRRQGLLPLREALLFRSFVYQNPPFAAVIKEFIDGNDPVDENSPASIDEGDHTEIGHKGNWVGEGVPAWTDNVESTQ